MKKHLSVLALCARNNLHTVIGLLCAMCASETLVFRLNWNKYLTYLTVDCRTFEDTLHWVPQLCFVFLMLLMIQLSSSGDQNHSTGYALRRLRIPEKTAVLWKAVYNVVCLLLFWAVQTAAVLGLGYWYTRLLDPQSVSAQTLFLAFYRDPFLHNLLPLGNWTRYYCIAALLAAAGFSASLMTYKLRRGSRYGWIMPLFSCILLGVYFRQGVGHWSVDVFGVLAAAAVMGVDAFYCWENAYYEE
ncbi:MAG: hypothetical protein K2O18_04145 [Oscillospiraceae bacterium]|nr:hypothetical protein [Oscillospiraceae bacterium]